MKNCPKCNQVKPFEAFYRSSTHKSGYASWCIVCEKARNRAKNTLDTVSRNAKAKEWRESNKATYLAGIERWRKANPGRHERLMKEWAENNRDKVNAKWMRRYANKKQRTPSWLTDAQYRQIELEYALADWCSTVMGEDYHVDHIIPLQGKTVSGLHVPWNLQVIPAKLNQQKSNKLEF